MALTFFWRCEGTTLDGTDDYTDGDSTATLNSAAAINTAAARIGTNGLDIPSPSDYAAFTNSANDLVSPVVGSLAFSFRYTTWVDGAVLVSLQGTAGNDFIRVELANTNEIQLRIRLQGISNLTLVTTDANLSSGTWYGIVVRWDEPNNDRKIEIYDSGGSAVGSGAEDLTTNFDQPTDIITCYFGEFSGSNADHHMDNIFLSQVYDEPLEDNLDITSFTNYGAPTSVPIGLAMAHYRRRHQFSIG